ncbi:hypothetical protein PIIN_09961 [Serendipita indica DSM 11827]|uniref:Uncharacterized protein n=1 Tax=Serendipita indica (strain DSM 11827) TaxID=1109443 RepID=G4TXC2_SERID|nr:hypothetical protein PIIN_09961 [Serendipita indica DSM 11827]
MTDFPIAFPIASAFAWNRSKTFVKCPYCDETHWHKMAWNGPDSRPMSGKVVKAYCGIQGLRYQIQYDISYQKITWRNTEHFITSKSSVDARTLALLEIRQQSESVDSDTQTDIKYLGIAIGEEKDLLAELRDMPRPKSASSSPSTISALRLPLCAYCTSLGKFDFYIHIRRWVNNLQVSFITTMQTPGGIHTLFHRTLGTEAPKEVASIPASDFDGNSSVDDLADLLEKAKIAEPGLHTTRLATRRAPSSICIQGIATKKVTQLRKAIRSRIEIILAHLDHTDNTLTQLLEGILYTRDIFKPQYIKPSLFGLLSPDHRLFLVKEQAQIHLTSESPVKSNGSRDIILIRTWQNQFCSKTLVVLLGRNFSPVSFESGWSIGTIIPIPFLEGLPIQNKWTYTQKSLTRHSEWPECPRRDQGMRGAFQASHAEMQALAFLAEQQPSSRSHSTQGGAPDSPDATILVTSEPCAVCHKNLNTFCQNTPMTIRVVYPGPNGNKRRLRTYPYLLKVHPLTLALTNRLSQ